MPRSALLDESKDDRWPGPAALGIDKVRIQATIARLFDEARPATVGKGDHLLHSTIRCQLIADIVNDRWEHAYRTLGTILGLEGTSVTAGDRKPLAKAANR